METHRIGPGDVIPGRTLATINGARVALPDPTAVVHLQFRRFAACPICNVHLRAVARHHAAIEAAGVREIVVFHSEVSAMRPHQADLPFAVIADPERELYEEFGVEFSPKALLSPAALTTPLKSETWRVAFREWRDPGSRPFRVRGGPISGLPAEFLIDPGATVRAAKYGRHAGDQWSVDEMLSIAGQLAAER